MTSPTYCAPCIADLALVREAATTVAGTASCMAHAVLLSHATDDPGRRRQRLDALKDLATSKAETAEPTEQVKLELLVQEYGLAGAMDMGQPARRGPQQQQQPPARQGAPSAPGEGRKSRRGRARGDRPEGQGGPGQGGQGQGGQGQGGQGQGGQGRAARARQPRGERRPVQGTPATDGSGETAPVTPAPGIAGEGAPAEVTTSAAPAAPTEVTPSAATAEAPAAPGEAPAAPAPEAPSSSAPSDAPAPESTPTPAPAASPGAPRPRPAVVPELGPGRLGHAVRRTPVRGNRPRGSAVDCRCRPDTWPPVPTQSLRATHRREAT